MTAHADHTANADQIAYWNEVAGPKWVANQSRIDRLMAPLTAALLHHAAAKPGEGVVDVGCGCGDLSRQIAVAVGPAGRVLAVDLSEPMLAHARTQAAAASDGGAPIEWRRADAMLHPFEPSADLLVSRFGVMFFADRIRAFANLRRASKPGGRFAFLTWRQRSDVEWMECALDWIAPVLAKPQQACGDIGPFALAAPDASCAELARAGFRDVAVHAVDAKLTVGSDGEDAFVTLRDTGPAANVLRDAPPRERAEGERLLSEELRRRFPSGPVELGGACWLYAGRA